MKRPTPESDLKLMRRMDGLHFEHPFSGSRMLRGLLSREGYEAGRSQYERTGESRHRSNVPRAALNAGGMPSKLEPRQWRTRLDPLSR